MGVARMERSVARSYYLCYGDKPHSHMMREVRAQCQVCQAWEPRNRASRGPMAMTPVPAQAMVHDVLDLFSIAPTVHQGRRYNSILVRVDRLSGWIVAAPCEKKGLTSRKAAQLMLERWEMFGIPEVVTSDRGSIFWAHGGRPCAPDWG